MRTWFLILNNCWNRSWLSMTFILRMVSILISNIEASHDINHINIEGVLCLGRKHTLTGMSIEDNSYTLNEAISLHRQTLQLQPALHPDRSTSLSNLASALLIRFEKEGQRCDLNDAIFFHREALEFQPSLHLYQSTFLDDLASALSIQCEQKGIQDLALIYREKEKPQEVVIVEKMKHVLEENDSDMLRSMTNLAFIYKYQGRWKEAEALEMVVMEKKRHLLGKQHSDASASMANLATTYSNQGQFKEAESSRAKTW